MGAHRQPLPRDRVGTIITMFAVVFNDFFYFIVSIVALVLRFIDLLRIEYILVLVWNAIILGALNLLCLR